MNIISNNCLGGYIYRNILQDSYKNPFIWTLFENPSEYIDLIENWNNVDFDDFIMTRKGKGLKNNFQILIDSKYTVSFIHIFFDPVKDNTQYFENTPRIVGENIFTPKPWEYITEKYVQRLDRMKKETNTVFFYFEPNISCSDLIRLPSVLATNKFRGVIFTDNSKVVGNSYATVLPALGLDLPSKICNHYRQEIFNICK